MTLYWKRKAEYVAAPPKVCSRCHERMGEIEVVPQAVVDASQTKSYWFCGQCAEAAGRSKAGNS
jgi:hypothetical protein